MEEVSFRRKIARLYKDKEFRPTGVAIPYFTQKGKIKFLTVTSPKCRELWYFPQGGIDKGESYYRNITREMHEELGIKDSELEVVFPLFMEGRIRMEHFGFNRDGFSKGKHYFFSLVNFKGDIDKIKPNPLEVGSHRWEDYNTTFNLLGGGKVISKDPYYEKRFLSRSALMGAVSLKKSSD